MRKLTKLTKQETISVVGGAETQTKIHEMARETNINRSKSASKIHNKMTQYISS